ncbi:hypothetical protein AALO_G00182830 [Alosa alosa]|uniref:Myb/SANT-like DNA-binding domain-containing protein n=1 Tax=Alosa alosa TaxID=278164 RepID=A0AAV6G986_9TELE|nr:uncharacterized protein LOC125306584 [Alosa alosa]KAG5271684.1 hypothetical protein AALO_G00182830 [Alosa alosa]
MEDHHPKRKRRPKFTDDELFALVSAVSENQDVLFGKFHLDIGRQARDLKTTAWQNVTDAVNSISDVQRSAVEVRTKYKYFKYDVTKKATNEKRHQEETDGYLSKKIFYTPAEKALRSLLEVHSLLGTSEGPFLNDVMALVVEEESHSPEPGKPLELPSCSVPAVGLPAEPEPEPPTVTTATSTSRAPTTNHLLSRRRRPRRTFKQHQRHLPSHRRTRKEMLVVQRQIRDLLQDMNNTIATGFRDIAAAIRSVADNNSHA